MTFKNSIHALRSKAQLLSPSVVKFLEFSIQFLVILSIIVLCLQTLPNISSKTQAVLASINTIIIIAFTIEYVVRLYLAPKRLKFIFSFYGLVDLFSIVPFYLSLGLVDSRALRLLRAIRVIRLLKLTRYSQALQRFGKAIILAKEELILFLIINIVFIFLAALGIYRFEHAAQPDSFRSIFDSLWWAIITLTTVGYGDMYPITMGGRIFTFFLLIIGLGIIAIPPGLVASAMTQTRLKEKNDSKK